MAKKKTGQNSPALPVKTTQTDNDVLNKSLEVQQSIDTTLKAMLANQIPPQRTYPQPVQQLIPKKKARWKRHGWKFWKHFTFIDEAKKFYKLASVWFIIALGSAPDIFNLAVSYHIVDATKVSPKLSFVLNVISFVGVLVRIMRMKKSEEDVGIPDFGGGMYGNGSSFGGSPYDIGQDPSVGGMPYQPGASGDYANHPPI